MPQLKRRPAPAPVAPRAGGLVAAAASLLALALLPACTSTTLDTAELGIAKTYAYQPERYPVHGIDVSKFQGDVNWAAARHAGVAFAWLKATEGGDRVDDNFASNWRGAAAAGIPRGAYHFFYHCRSGKEQAEWFIRNVPKDPTALPPVLDVEWTPDSPTCTRRMPRKELIAEMKAFLDTVEAYYGVRPIIYAPIDMHRDRLVGAFPKHEFWLRAVKDHPNNVYEDRDFRFWQWTATGAVPGVAGDVDRNAFAGSTADWQRWLKAHRSG
ncbi:glycoside hydrolase family 25 protein [Mangrovibrevibacter kandeliae]|uniref:glycoside hydrolase family 25 protein n=1 Tax=Mangrovibrevibacter kandeliae TaxID=2968473 RepID=UPI002118848F|nr:glycoside hydrolase family 25 protein [Aurantimonas sp. CSK15Z-1]MCQ8783951.1 glycoside hydrolase family 25 protein [Aurantimonas sp. CSK15Z-1]